MENYCMVASKYYEENPGEAYSCDTFGHPEYPPFYADDDHYFDIDISIPYSPADAIPFSSLNHDDSEDKFDLDLSIFTAPPPSPDLCSSPAGNLCYQSQLLPLQLLTQPLDDTNIYIAFPQSRDVPGVKFKYPKLIEIAAKPSMDLQSAKPSMDLQSPRTKFVHGLQKKSKDSDHGEGVRKNMDRNKKGDKEMIHKYVNMIKPLYDKISQRGYNEKIRCGDLDKKPRSANGHKILLLARFREKCKTNLILVFLW